MRDLRLSGVMLAAVLAAQGSGAAFGQAMTGDLDGNHEVSLTDMTDFVGCLSGPDNVSGDPSCAAALFDADDDVDLRDVAAFQNRFGFGVGPPRIDRFWPTPGEWIVDDIGLTHVQVGFSEPVIVQREAIIVWLASAGIGNTKVEHFTLAYDSDADLWVVTFVTPLRDDRVTLVLDYAIEDLSGRPLDGEIINPHNASLPSGDGHNGGQAVFRINVLQGDANKDGLVDESDAAMVNASSGLCDGGDGFLSDADLNRDGCVDAADLSIVTGAIGRELTGVDGTPPRVIGVYADGNFGAFDTLDILFSEPVDGFRASERTCFLLDANDNVVVPAYYGGSLSGDVLGFSIVPTYSHCNLFRINISNAVIDLSGEFLERLQPCTCLEDCPPYGGEP
jgi:hypothetical protein